MAQVKFADDQYKRLVRLVEQRADVLTAAEREQLLEFAGLTRFKGHVSFDAVPKIFSGQLVRVLHEHGTLRDTGQPALVSLLRELRTRVEGHEDDRALLDALLAPYAAPDDLDGARSPDGGDELRVLFFAANPDKTGWLRTDREIRAIEARIREAPARDRIRLERGEATQWPDVARLLLDHRPHVVHFAGHGSKGGEIVLEGTSGEPHPVPADTLADLFDVLADDIRCVILNACWSARQAEAIRQHIDCVVGMDRPVEDTDAITFAAGLYRGIAYHRSLLEAFRLGRNEMAGERGEAGDARDLGAETADPGPSRVANPRLITREGVDAADIVLLPERR